VQNESVRVHKLGQCQCSRYESFNVAGLRRLT
jgi:hypothetical protein